MKLGVISDTHDNIEPTEKAIEFFEDQEVDAVVHCGDMVAPFTAELFDRDSFDFYAVRGNNDGEWNLKQTVQEFGRFYNNIAELEFEDAGFSDEKSCSEQRSGENDVGRVFAVYHGTDPEIVRGLVESGEYDYVLRGHTHQKKINEVDGTIEINPGGIRLPGQDERFHVVILDVETGEVEFHRVRDL